MIEIVFEREGPKSATIYISVEGGLQTYISSNTTWTTWGLNRWLQNEIHLIRQILKDADPNQVVTIREEK